MAMDDASNTFRLAIGVFYEAPRLASAIAELQADGVTAAQTCLAGIRQAIDALASGPASDGQGSEPSTDKLDKLRVLAPHVNGLELVATDGQLLHTLLEHVEADQSGNSSAHSWLLPDLFGSLTDHLRAGAIALLVSASDFGRQRRSSRILLRNTAHTIQTHEFTPRRSGTP
jgi:hypothetical protein